MWGRPGVVNDRSRSAQIQIEDPRDILGFFSLREQCRGKFLNSENHGDSWTFRFAYPKEIGRYLVFKGSVSVEGISLTIANLTDEYFEIAVIPKTLELTNFSHLQPHDEVNLEADVIAKYVERMLGDREIARPVSP